jgi:replicative DNA helicase
MVADKSPPHSIDAEQGLLGSVMYDPSILDDVAAIVRPGDFFRDSHRLVWEAIVGLLDAGESADGLIVADELERRGRLDREEADQVVTEALKKVPHAFDGVRYARIVRYYSDRREMIAAALDVIRRAYANEDTTEGLAAFAGDRFLDIGASEASRTWTAADAVESALAAYRDRRDGVLPGLRTGLGGFDAMVGGLRPGRMIVVAARPSIGKSALVTTMLANVAAAGTPVYLFSLEMDVTEVGERLICGHGGIDGHRFMHPWMMMDHEHAAVERAGAEVAKFPFFIDDSGSRTVRQIAGLARRAVRRDGVKAIAVDYLQLLERDDPRARLSRTEFVTECSARLRRLAKELNVPVVVVAQLNRKAEERDSKRPEMSDLRESGAIEQDAHVVALIHRPGFYDARDDNAPTEVIVRKNRGGPTGVVKLKYLKEQTRFIDWEEPEPDFTHRGGDEPF